MRFLMRDLKYTGSNADDVIISIGKEESYMLKKTLKFSQSDAFIGFHGIYTATAGVSITKIGALKFKCGETKEFESGDEEKDWQDYLNDFYGDYKLAIWIGGFLIFVLLSFCIGCCCWVRCKRKEIKKLQ